MHRARASMRMGKLRFRWGKGVSWDGLVSLSLVKLRGPAARAISAGFAATLCAMMAAPLPSHGEASTEMVFENKCAGCHVAGGNIQVPGKTLKLDDLEKNDVASIQSIAAVISEGKDRMPGFGAKCEGANCTFAERLTDDQVRDLAEYVANKAKQGW